jgi:D-xylose transport system ATP-binding protein
MGAGRSELLMHLYGAWGVRLRGVVRVRGDAFDAPSPSESLRRGLALVTEDRRRYGLVPGESVGFNLTLSTLPRLTRRGLLDATAEARLYRRMSVALGIRCAGPEAPMQNLSGGNQQKVLLGRALLPDPAVILLDEPTRGVDVATKREIYEQINRLTDDGRAVLLVTSELPELLGLSDRILVLRRGRIAAELARDQFSQERVLDAALGQARGGPR